MFVLFMIVMRGDDEHLGVTHVDDVAQIQLPPNSQRLIDLRSLVVLRSECEEE